MWYIFRKEDIVCNEFRQNLYEKSSQIIIGFFKKFGIQIVEM